MKSENTFASNHRNQPTGKGSYGSIGYLELASIFRNSLTATLITDCCSLTVMWEALLTVWDDKRMSKPCFDNSPSRLLQGARTQGPPRAGTEKSCFQVGESMRYDFSLCYKYYPCYTQCVIKYVLYVLWTMWNQTMCQLDPAAMCILIFYAITYFRN